jgi:hypothetical protein
VLFGKARGGRRFGRQGPQLENINGKRPADGGFFPSLKAGKAGEHLLITKNNRRANLRNADFRQVQAIDGNMITFG